jgi:hypothetical protein
LDCQTIAGAFPLFGPFEFMIEKPDPFSTIAEKTPSIGNPPSKALMYLLSDVSAPGRILARNQHPA